ncbi:actin filament-associated protein 1-like 2 [Brachyhypopomus gauderio]|uniref:actin filament-associated protein 1-like 2 n=1 Tax=Brachyhypopomus gauderio TaxID=698409 RepID=UPI0040436FEF
MDKQKVLARLVSDLQAFLLVLDGENLSYFAQAQKKSISELLSKLQDNKDSPVEDAEYMIMNCSPGEPKESSVLEDHPTGPTLSSSAGWLQGGSVGPDVTPHSPEVEEEDDCYEEAEPFIPASHSTDKLDSDSSHYESYGEEEEEFVKDRAHYVRWSASQPNLRHSSESRICGYLWRKRWLGQWTRQLFIIKHDCLLCFKCAKDLHPLLEMKLPGCQVVYKSKRSKRMQRELKVVSGASTLVLGFQSCSLAEEWRKIIEELSGSSYEPESHSSSSIMRSERLESCRSSPVLHSDSEEETLSLHALHSAVSSVEINKEQTRAGYLNVLMSCQWQTLWCRVEQGLLKMFGDESSEETPQYTLQLQGSEVQPGPDTAHAYRITILQHGDQVAVLEASCSDEKDQWVQLLQDGSSTASGLPYQHTKHEPLSGLKVRRFPTSNTYIDDPFQQLCGAVRSQPIYSNTSILEHMFHKSHTSGSGESGPSGSVHYSNNELFSPLGKKVCETERCVQKLELAGKRVQLRAGSEVNLANVTSKSTKRSSFRQSLLPFCSERTQGGILTPLLRRTASVKNSLKRAPSALFIEHGKVFQRRKEWETKALA